jgi:hypothetical protein
MQLPIHLYDMRTWTCTMIVGEIWCYGQLGKSPLHKMPLEVRGSEKLAEIFARQNEQLLETLELREQARSHFRIGTALLAVAPKTQ